MEIANDENPSMPQTNGARVARRSDAQAITKLMQHALYTHVHADWHFPIDWLGSPEFVVIEQPSVAAGSPSMANRFFSNQSQLAACLAIAADPLPSAWVRVAAVSEKVDGLQALTEMCHLVEASLALSDVQEIGWLQVNAWPSSWIRSIGFEKLNFMETFVKQGTEIPVVNWDQSLIFRPVKPNDLETLAKIEALAYTPLWRSSVTSLTLARRQAFSFDVVEVDDQIIGYQYSTLMVNKAHLSRITVHPEWQGRGIGSSMLAYAIEGYKKKGVTSVSLNTQIDNKYSRRMYDRFGFHPTGDRFAIWIKNFW